MLRGNAPKMQLRESEEQNLELDLMGQGFQAKFSVAQDIPGLGDFIPPRLDFAYGVCAYPSFQWPHAVPPVKGSTPRAQAA